MNPAFLPFNSFDSINSFNASENDDLNAYSSDLLSQQESSTSFASSAPAAYNEVDGLFTANGDLTSAETSFCEGLPTDLTWEDYLLITEGLLLEGAPSFDKPAGIAPGVSNINTSGGPSTFNVAAGSADIYTSGALSTFNFGAESAGINMPAGLPALNPATGDMGISSPPMSNLASGNTGIIMPGALPTFDFTAGSANINIPVGPQTKIEHPSYLGCGNGGLFNGTNAGDPMFNGGWVGPGYINGVVPNISSDTSSETQSPPKRPNPPSARHTTPQRRSRERAPSPAVMPNMYSKNPSNTSSETQSPPKRSRSSSPAARPPPKRRKDWRQGPEATFRFVHDERSMPTNFQANPDNHGRFQYSATGRRKYLNGPGAVQERRRRREGNQGAD